MRRTLGATALATLLLQGSALAAKQHWQLAMNNAELRDVVEEMSAILGTTVVLDPRVQGRITVMSNDTLDREGVRRLFYSVLDAHDFTVIDQGDRILITPVAEAKTRAGNGNAQTSPASQYVTEVIELNASTAADIAGLIRPLVSTHGHVGPSVSANALVVSDTASNVRRIAQIVRQLDSGTKNSHDVVVLLHGVAADIAKVMEPALGKAGAEAGGQVLADARSNRLVIIGTQATRQRLARLARSLDVPSTAKFDNARVIRLRHSDAKQLAEILDTMGPGLTPEAGGGLARAGMAATTTPTFMVKADESQNALVLMAEPNQIRMIENIVQQLDQPRAQVLIHAAIVEVSGDVVQALGVQWALNTGDATGLLNLPGTGLGILNAFSSDNKLQAPEGALLHLGSDRFGALISALASNTHSNLLSTPSLLTLDNQEAEIIVGQNVPFKTGSYATSSSGAENPFTTVERKDVGISLKIKPHINEGSTLRLEVEQEVSDIAPVVSGVDSSDLITNKRALKSTILAEDGDIIVIGGLMKDSVRTQQSGVPLLRSVPYLGALFRWNREIQTKSNLMVFLRPTIVRSKHDIEQVSQDRYNALRYQSKPAAGDSKPLLPSDPHQMFDGYDDPPRVPQHVGTP
ncbi:Type II secretion system protein D precursor [compost metagenome]